MKTTKTILSGEHAVSDKQRIALCIEHIESQNLEISGLRGQVAALEERVAVLERPKAIVFGNLATTKPADPVVAEETKAPKKTKPPKKPKGVSDETTEATA
jgi:hypothetical protein